MSEALLKRKEEIDKENAAKNKAKAEAAAKKRIERQLAEIEAAEKAAVRPVNTIYCDEADCGYIVNNLDCCPFHPMGRITRTKPIIVTPIKMHPTEVMHIPTVRHALTKNEAQKIIDTRNAKLIKTVKCNNCLLANCNCPQKLPSSKLPFSKLKKKVSFAQETKSR